MEKSRRQNCILRVLQGVLIGAGAILPGVSGGVLAVIFGIYRPAMELLTHPKRALARYWRMLLAVAVGWVIGFLGGGGAILVLFHQSETVATCLFIGLIQRHIEIIDAIAPFVKIADQVFSLWNLDFEYDCVFGRL